MPFFCILCLTAAKELIEDVKRHQADKKINNKSVKVWSRRTKKFVEKPWKDVVVGDVVQCDNEESFPADLVLLGSSEPQGICYIETASLDGETNLKQRSAHHSTADVPIHELDGQIECEAPNRNLYEFTGNIAQGARPEPKPLNKNSILLRGAKLMNTKWIFGAVIYTGHETKLMMNSTKAPLKRSTIDRNTNYQIIFLFLILIVMSLASALARVLQETPMDLMDFNNGTNSANTFHVVTYTTGTTGEKLRTFFGQMLTFVILYNNLIPISLLVTVEIVRFIQAYFISWDEKMYHHPSDKEGKPIGEGTYAQARTSNLNEELGQIKYVFSDKTGTLTQVCVQ